MSAVQNAALALVPWHKIHTVVLVIATILVIVGSALIWRAFDATSTAVLAKNQASSNQYQSMVFVFALVAAWLHHLCHEKDKKGRVVWRFIFFGFVYFAAVRSINSWQQVDTNRHYYDTDQGFLDASSSTKRLFGGEILAYMALFLAAIAVHGAIQIPKGFHAFLYVVAIALNIIGSVILWNLSAVQLEDGNTAVRTAAFTMAVSQWITLLILWGSVFHKHSEGAKAAVMGIAITGLWYLSSGFSLKDTLNSIDDSSTQGARSWAGSLFCWFSAIVALYTAHLVVSTADTGLLSKLTV